MKICVIGAGYVGLVSGACFADLGNTVWCVDKNKQKIDMLNNNKIPIFEPGLKELVIKNYSSGRIKFTSNLSLGVKKSDIEDKIMPRAFTAGRMDNNIVPLNDDDILKILNNMY